MTLEAEPVSPGEALSGKLSGKLLMYLLQGSLMTFDFLVHATLYVSIKHPVCNFLFGDTCDAGEINSRNCCADAVTS